MTWCNVIYSCACVCVWVGACICMSDCLPVSKLVCLCVCTLTFFSNFNQVYQLTLNQQMAKNTSNHSLTCNKQHRVRGKGFVACHGGSVMRLSIQIAQTDCSYVRVQNHHRQLSQMRALVHVGDFTRGKVRWTKGMRETQIWGGVPGKYHPVIARLLDAEDEGYCCCVIFPSDLILGEGLDQTYCLKAS